ncbi:MAG: HD domain-containing protein [Candidatus Marinimicrobia bacterium]|nr:HD domain-containing protein [Candidatus Neomarinimicrobiota bacterium]MCF7828083.1 HD domain-containing protein [Candidatus Neomarinimicrobiota bacterium]MCF7879742.1 HD domain-containing protein [Candidatus Neomarinimicrobiota bacterium]
MEKIQQRLDEIAETYLERSGEETCLQLTGAVDSVLLKAASHFREKVLLIGIGGFGRRELSRFSDVDLLVLYSEADKDEIEELLKQFLHPLWDARLDVKYSAHTLSEVEAKAVEDSDFASALTEYRILFGREDLAKDFKGWADKYFDGGKKEFVNIKLEESKARRDKYGNTYKLLEPNIKESAGGLRDLHTIHWIAVGKGWCTPGVTSEESIGSSEVLQWMVNNDFITSREYAAIKDAYDFLLQVRHGTHFITQSKGSKSNFLDINIRHTLAEQFGYILNGEPDVQAFMLAYYRAARELDYAHNFFLQEKRYREQSGQRFRRTKSLKGFPGLLRQGNKVILDEKQSLPKEPTLLVKFILYAQEHDLQLTSGVRHTIEQVVHSLDDSDFQTPEVGEILNNILLNPDAGEMLRTLLYTEMLVKIIPEISTIRRLHIQSMFHYYTVDEHTFRAIDNLQNKLFNSSNSDPYKFEEVYENLSDTIPLYWALLLHDFGKAVDRDEHDEIGAELVGTILERLGQEKYTDTVKFLIAEHMEMEMHALRRDVNREETIRSFAEIVQDEDSLRLMYLMTFSDISAVKPDLWTDWKATLLYELYWKTRQYLRKEPIRPPSDEIGGISEELQEEFHIHTDEMGFRYTALFSEQEIQEHIRAINRLKDPDDERSVVVYQVNEVGFTKLSVITRDRPKLLSTVCSVLTSHDCDIIDASIFTREDDIAIDQFRVIPVGGGTHLNSDSHKAIRKTLEKVFADEETPEQLIEQAEQRWRWHAQSSFGVAVSPHIQWTREQKYIVLEVTGQDQTGLLYYLTRMIAEVGFNIHSAKIHTENHEITDIFYLGPPNGYGVDSEETNQVLNELEKTLRKFLK